MNKKICNKKNYKSKIESIDDEKTCQLSLKTIQKKYNLLYRYKKVINF